jgi:hypothetical protein
VWVGVCVRVGGWVGVFMSVGGQRPVSEGAGRRREGWWEPQGVRRAHATSRARPPRGRAARSARNYSRSRHRARPGCTPHSAEARIPSGVAFPRPKQHWSHPAPPSAPGGFYFLPHAPRPRTTPFSRARHPGMGQHLGCALAHAALKVDPPPSPLQRVGRGVHQHGLASLQQWTRRSRHAGRRRRRDARPADGGHRAGRGRDGRGPAGGRRPGRGGAEGESHWVGFFGSVPRGGSECGRE